MAANIASITPETLIVIKVSLDDAVKKLKLPFKDLSSTVLPDKLRACLGIAPDRLVVFERYSDSADGYITLDPDNVPVFKALIRAAKAKRKLRLKATIILPALDHQEQEADVRKSISGVMKDPAPHSCYVEDESMLPCVSKYQVAVPCQREHTSALQQNRDSAALDCRSVGSGIFQYRDALATQQSPANDEAPVPQPFTAHTKSDKTREATLQACQELAFRTREPTTCTAMNHAAWSVYCNVCDKAMSNAHYHCSICDGGDYDLCEACVSSGKACPGEDHWLIKRFIQEGKVVTSTTERVNRKTQTTPEVETKVPGAFNEEAKALTEETPSSTQPSRTCNNCVVVLPEHEFVTCDVCADFDLCTDCHGSNTHGHHPGHSFQAATTLTVLSINQRMLLKPGRNVEHNAFCDGCDKKIRGIRHKCLQCPDWDYCNDCVGSASSRHPRHRFAAIYDQLPEPHAHNMRHYGIYCDGPLCDKKSNQSYIHGVRYKCAVCHDTDFCARCEALPGNNHNRTHPLIKFATPVRNVNITTVNEDGRGNVRNMGDRQPERAVKTENAPTPVQIVADIAPSDEKVVQKSPQPLDGDVSCARTGTVVPASALNAIFIKDSIADGTIMAPDERFFQTWTLRNEGPFVWPVGCSVRYVGGDNMLNIDNRHPASVATMYEATESSIIAREVQVGEEVAFRITLKAPKREGKSISYWRLKSPDGTPFGHRLWCDIEVRSDKIPAALQPLPCLPPQANQRCPMTNRVPSAQEAVLDTIRHNQAVPTLQDSTNGWLARAQQHAHLHAMRQLSMGMLNQEQSSRDAQAPGARMYCATVPPSSERKPNTPYGRPQAIDTEDGARKEAAKTRMNAIRARIMQSREENLNAYAALRDARKAHEQIPVVPVSAPLDVTEPKTASIEPAASPVTVPVPAVEEQEPEQHAADAVNESASSSQMIFPKLDKESPASSIIVSSKGKAAYVENEEGQIESSAVPQSPAATEDLDDLELVSVIAASEDEDDGFLTDEEYDILDASDRETVASP